MKPSLPQLVRVSVQQIAITIHELYGYHSDFLPKGQYSLYHKVFRFYDEEFAQIRGVHVKPLYFLMIVMLAVGIVMIIQVVGLILVIALLTIPPYIAEKYSKSLIKMMVLSSLLSAIFTVTGLWLSYALNLTSGASIILAAGIGFLASFGLDYLLPNLSAKPVR